MGDGKDDSTLHEEFACPGTTQDGDAHLKSPGIPLARKICYAVGGMPYQMTSVAKGFFMQIFLLDVVQMGAVYASLILFLGRAWDAITDPIVGYMVSQSGRTRFGKLIPWIVFSMPLGVVSCIMMWFTPQNSMSPGFSFFWFFTWTCLFDLFMSCYHVPFSSLNMFLGGDQKDRDSATGYRMGMEMFATLAGATIQGQIVGVYHAKRAQTCSQLNYSDTLLNQSTPSLQNFTSVLTDSLQNTSICLILSSFMRSVFYIEKDAHEVHSAQVLYSVTNVPSYIFFSVTNVSPTLTRAYVLAALVLAMFHVLCCVVLFVGVKEQLAPLSTLDRIKMPFLAGMKMVVKHTPYVRLVFGFLFSSLAFQMAQGNFALFCTHATGLGPYFQHIVLILLTSATLSIPLWQTLLGRLGKKTTLFIGLSIYAPALAGMVCVRSSLPVFIVLSIISGSSLGSLYLIPWSMLPDVVDDFKVKNPGCKDLEPMFYSCYVFFNKFGGGLSVGISTLVLHFAGYKPGACRHQPAVITALQVLMAPVPIALLLIGMLLFCFYPINEETRQQIQRDLQKAEKEDGGVAVDTGPL